MIVISFHEHVDFLSKIIKGMSMGGSFLENLKFLKFLHSFIWYSMHDLIFKHVNRNMIFPKPQSIEYINTSTCLEICEKSNLKCYVEEMVESMELWI